MVFPGELGITDPEGNPKNPDSVRAAKQWAQRWNNQKSDPQLKRESFDYSFGFPELVTIPHRGKKQKIVSYTQQVDYMAPDELDALQRLHRLPQIMKWFYQELDALMSDFLDDRKTNSNFQHSLDSVLSQDEDWLCLFQIRFVAQKKANTKQTNTIPYSTEVDLLSLADDQLADYETYGYWVINHLQEYLEHTPFTLLVVGEGSILERTIMIVFDEQKNMYSSGLTDEGKEMSDQWFMRWMTEDDSSDSKHIHVLDDPEHVETDSRPAQTFWIDYMTPTACTSPMDISSLFQHITPDAQGRIQNIKIRFGKVVEKNPVAANFGRLSESQRRAYLSFIEYLYGQIEERFRFTQYRVIRKGNDILQGEIEIKEDEHKEGELLYLLTKKAVLIQTANDLDTQHEITRALQTELENYFEDARSPISEKVKLLCEQLVRIVKSLNLLDDEKLVLAYLFEEKIEYVVREFIDGVDQDNYQSEIKDLDKIFFEYLGLIVSSFHPSSEKVFQKPLLAEPWQIVGWLNS